jgi:hypothetical protein
MLDYKNAIMSPPPPTIVRKLDIDIDYTIKVKARPTITNYTESCLRGAVASRLKLIQRTAGKEYLLSMKAPKYSDFGIHTCQFQNSVGVLTLKYLVKPKGKYRLAWIGFPNQVNQECNFQYLSPCC